MGESIPAATGSRLSPSRSLRDLPYWLIQVQPQEGRIGGCMIVHITWVQRQPTPFISILDPLMHGWGIDPGLARLVCRWGGVGGYASCEHPSITTCHLYKSIFGEISIRPFLVMLYQKHLAPHFVVV